MTSEEKLEKVEELIAARDEITAELLALMGEQAAMKKQSRRKRNRHHDKRKFPHQQKRKVARSVAARAVTGRLARRQQRKRKSRMAPQLETDVSRNMARRCPNSGTTWTS
jgi:hypothetical protein